MSEQENLQLVQQVYAAFGRGDIPAVLNALSDNVEWREPGPPDVLPWAGTRRGREQVAQFFAVIAETIEFKQFEPQEFIAQGDKVVVLVHQQVRVKSTGRAFEQDTAQVFTLREGKVTKFHIYEDTAAIVAAFRGA